MVSSNNCSSVVPRLAPVDHHCVKHVLLFQRGVSTAEIFSSDIFSLNWAHAGLAECSPQQVLTAGSNLVTKLLSKALF
jgi:hypothetical protein